MHQAPFRSHLGLKSITSAMVYKRNQLERIESKLDYCIWERR